GGCGRAARAARVADGRACPEEVRPVDDNAVANSTTSRREVRDRRRTGLVTGASRVAPLTLEQVRVAVDDLVEVPVRRRANSEAVIQEALITVFLLVCVEPAAEGAKSGWIGDCFVQLVAQRVDRDVCDVAVRALGISTQPGRGEIASHPVGE